MRECHECHSRIILLIIFVLSLYVPGIYQQENDKKKALEKKAACISSLDNGKQETIFLTRVEKHIFCFL